MTRHKVYELLDEYEARLKAAGYTTPLRCDGEDYSVFSAAGKEQVGAHLLFMAQEGKELFNQAKGPKGFRWLGWLQHGLVDLGLYKLSEIKEHARNADEYEFPPPPGMQTAQAKVMLTFVCAHCGTVIFKMARQTWVPLGHHIAYLRFPKRIDPEDRLEKIQGIGIRIDLFTHAIGWDYTDLSYNVIMRPTVLDPHLTEESVALLVTLLKAAGWAFAEDADKPWAERWARHHIDGTRRGPNPDCPCPHPHGPGLIIGPQGIQVVGGDGPVEVDVDPTEEENKPRKKKKKKKGDNKDGEEGTPDAGGTKG